MKLKLITYNIWHGTYLDKVIAFLKTEMPDVLQLQEIGQVGCGFESTHTINLFTEIREALGLMGVYEHMFWGDTGQGRYDMGVATYSRLPIVDTAVFAYERTTTMTIDPTVKDRYFMPRKLLGVKLGVGLRPLWFFNTHMTITPDAMVTKRQLQSVAQVKGYLQRYDEYVLTGDMNAPPDTETYRKLAKGLVEISPLDEPTLHPRIHKVGHLGLHVDYVLYTSSRIKPLTATIPVIDASDHLPIVVKLEIG